MVAVMVLFCTSQQASEQSLGSSISRTQANRISLAGFTYQQRLSIVSAIKEVEPALHYITCSPNVKNRIVENKAIADAWDYLPQDLQMKVRARVIKQNPTCTHKFGLYFNHHMKMPVLRLDHVSEESENGSSDSGSEKEQWVDDERPIQTFVRHASERKSESNKSASEASHGSEGTTHSLQLFADNEDTAPETHEVQVGDNVGDQVTENSEISSIARPSEKKCFCLFPLCFAKKK